MDVFEQAKQLHLKQIELLDELKYALQVENGEITHEIKQQGGLCNEQWYQNNYYYHLIDIKEAKIVCSGNKIKIRSYTRLRNIKQSQIKYTGVI